MNETAHKIMEKVFADAAWPVPPKWFLSSLGGEQL